MTPTVLYLAGSAHCGSTILDILLGDAEPVLGGGQLADLYKHERCSCGRRLRDCPQWGPVLDHPSFPGLRPLRRTGRWTRKEIGLPRMVVSEARRAEYARIHDGLFEAIFSTVDADLIVDSSKNMARAIALLEASRFRIRVVHLVRDPRGFIRSTNKRNRENDRRRQFAAPLAEWIIKNGIGSTLLRRAGGDRVLEIRYEDLLLHPDTTLAAIGSHVDRSFATIRTKIEEGVPFEPDHRFAGNRVSQRSEVIFDPQRIRSNEMAEPGNTIFWYGGGWISRTWGYDRGQTYLPEQSVQSDA